MACEELIMFRLLFTKHYYIKEDNMENKSRMLELWDAWEHRPGLKDAELFDDASIAQITWLRMIGWLVNNKFERILKEATIA
jgi:hypothetical protein